MRTITTTLAIVHKGESVLLGMKKRGFGAGKWNGFGGKVELETIEENMFRETKEECGIEIANPEYVGLLHFGWQGNPEHIEMHVFKVTDFSGEPTETEEMRPEWFPVEGIPFEDMWPDDILWMPLLLAGKKFKGRFVFDQDGNMLEKELKETEDV